MVIVGLGKAGCNIASLFKKDKQYDVFSYDSGKNIKTQDSVEGYENNPPKLNNKILKTNKKVWFIVSGAAKVAGCTLQMLQQIKDKDINVVYIYPDKLTSSNASIRRGRVVFNVLQQYARSGLLNCVYLVSNDTMFENFGSGSIIDYYGKINDVIHSTINFINYYDNTDPVFGTKAEFKDFSRIRTFGLVDLEKNEENLFFSLDNITETCYNYSISEREIKESDQILSLIQKKQEVLKLNKTITSFRIYTTNFENNFCHMVAATHFIQQEII